MYIFAVVILGRLHIAAWIVAGEQYGVVIKVAGVRSCK